ncbi:hypothetical protein Dda3937_04428 [Dickeya dadantii 3937]|uniref:Uncharacterized protein n=1 Tax=Dickeya dadantii (strain 3937) TaxID=198628 RepID=E0SEM4_DICD3|nr:hypothetical protein Dda3937_04428 [Dickeya dadantii 3937]
MAFEPLLVVRAMQWKRNDTVYPARNYSLTRQDSPFVRQHGCLSTASAARRRPLLVWIIVADDNEKLIISYTVQLRRASDFRCR